MTGGDCHAAATFRLPKSGKWYVEFPKYGNGAPQAISVTRAHKEPYQYDGYLGLADHVQYVSNGEIGNRTRGSTSDAPTWQDDADIIVAMAVDMDNGAVYFAREDTWINSGVPTSGSAKTGAIATDLLTDNDGEHYIGVQGYNGNNNYGMYANFGQRPFTYTPPTGYKKLCAKNLPPNVPSIVRPQRYFDNLLYTGTGSSNIVEGLEFSPDMIWVKGRDTNGTEHMIIDSVRGGDASLVPSSTDTESTHGGRSMTFYPGGVRWNSDSNTCNANGENYVMWCWKGGGAAVSNTDGSITSSVSANTEAGFSIVSYTGNQTSGATVGHGLNSKPKWFIIKERGNTNDWTVYHESLGSTGGGDTYVLFLNLTNDRGGGFAGGYNNTAPTSSVFSLGNSVETNRSGGSFIAYCWAEVPGYSKFGQYTGSGSEDGSYVPLGFKPAFLLLRRIDDSKSWILFDNKRSPSNLVDKSLYPNRNDGDNGLSNLEVDFLSNGFKIKNSVNTINASDGTYVYMAFADQQGQTPFNTFPNAS